MVGKMAKEWHWPLPNHHQTARRRWICCWAPQWGCPWPFRSGCQGLHPFHCSKPALFRHDHAKDSESNVDYTIMLESNLNLFMVYFLFVYWYCPRGHCNLRPKHHLELHDEALFHNLQHWGNEFLWLGRGCGQVYKDSAILVVNKNVPFEVLTSLLNVC